MDPAFRMLYQQQSQERKCIGESYKIRHFLKSSNEHILNHAGSSEEWKRTKEKKTLILALLFGICRVNSNLLIILLKSCKIFAGLCKFTLQQSETREWTEKLITDLFHTLSDVPVHEGTLRVHQVELIICHRKVSRDSTRYRRMCVTESTPGNRNGGGTNETRESVAILANH